MATKQQSDAVDKALAMLLVHYENVVILGSSYDPTRHATTFVQVMEGNDFAIKGHVEDFADKLRDGISDGCDCGQCDCGADPEDHDEMNGLDVMDEDEDGPNFNV